MIVLCIAALLIGMSLPYAMTIVHFAVGLVVATVSGVAVALLCGATLGFVAIWAAVLFVTIQVGYGAGHFLMLVTGQPRKSELNVRAISTARRIVP